MLKKLTTLLFIAMASTNLIAASKTTTLQSMPWSIRAAGALWYIPNAHGVVKVTFTVNKTVTGRNLPSDPVTLYCDQTYTVFPGNTVTCSVSKFVRPEFQVAPQNYHNGADGSYTVS